MARRPKAALTAAELENRRLALESALGSLRIEGMELEPEGREILDRFARGEISLPEMRKCHPLLHRHHCVSTGLLGCWGAIGQKTGIRPDETIPGILYAKANLEISSQWRVI